MQAGYQAPRRTWANSRKLAKAVATRPRVYGAGLGYGAGNSDAEF